MMNLVTRATVVALVLLPILGVSQQQIGNNIELSKIYTEFKMSSDGKFIIVDQFPNTRTFKYENGDWEEKKQITDKNWVHYDISKNGKTFVGSEVINFVTKETKAFVYDLIGNEWILRPNINENIFPQSTATLGGHEFVISSDGNNLAILNNTKWSEGKTYINIWKFENNNWSKEFETTIEDCREPNGQFDTLSKTLLINGMKSNYKQFSNIYLKQDSWQNSKLTKVEYSILGNIKLSNDGMMLNCLFNLNSSDPLNAKIIVEKYKLIDEIFTIVFRQELPFHRAYFSDFTSDGNCFVTAYDPFLDVNKVRLFKLVQNTFLELPTILVDNNSKESYGYGVHLSDDCSILALGVRPKSSPFINTQIRVYDISNLQTSIEDWKMQKGFNLFPNPTHGLVKIMGLTTSAKISIFNDVGMFVNQINTIDNEIDLVDLPPGIYILTIETKERTEKHRIIKME